MYSLFKFLATNVYLHIWLGVAGIAVYQLFKMRKAPKALLVLLAMMWIIGTRPIPELLLKPLEYEHPLPEEAFIRESGIKTIVVLTGGGYAHQEGEYYHNNFSLATMSRLTGTLELAGIIGDSVRIVYSGAGEGLLVADYMKQFTLTVTDRFEVISDTLSRTTNEHPQNVREIIGDKRFFLVTSAAHMRRSMKVFRDAGMSPVPFPVDFLFKRDLRLSDLVPNLAKLIKLQTAVYEYLGLVLYSLK